jgi:putative copper export protein
MAFHLEKPTFLAAVAYIVLAFIVLLPLNIGELDPNFEKTNKYSLMNRLLILFVMIIPIGLSLYSINCMVKGKCMTWSYINSIFICIWVVVFVLVAILSNQQQQKYK